MSTNSKEYMRTYREKRREFLQEYQKNYWQKYEKKTFVLNKFVKDFELIKIMDLQNMCEDFINPQVIKYNSPTRARKKKTVLKIRKEYELLKRTVEEKLKKYTPSALITLFLEYKQISREAYNNIYTKLYESFENSFYNLVIDTINQKLKNCESAIIACEKEFLEK